MRLRNKLKKTALFLLPAAFLLLAGCNAGENENTLRASGTIDVTEVRISARMPGEVRVLAVEEGDAVSKGDTLAIIDHDLLVLQVRQAEAGAAAAAAQLALLKRGARAEDVAQAEAQLAQAEVQAEQAEQDAARMRALSESGSTTRKQLDDAEARLALAIAGREAAQQAVARLQNLIRPEELRASEAQLQQAQASINLLHRQIENAYVIAPISGMITAKMVEAGEMLGQGSPIVTIADLTQAYLRIYVPETRLGSIRLGQEVEVYTDAEPEQPLKGRVTFISPEAEFTPKNVQTKEERVKLVYEVKVEAPNASSVLKPGMYADAVLRLDETER